MIPLATFAAPWVLIQTSNNDTSVCTRSEHAGHACLLLAEHCYHVLYRPVPQLCSQSFHIYIHPKQAKIILSTQQGRRVRWHSHPGEIRPLELHIPIVFFTLLLTVMQNVSRYLVWQWEGVTKYLFQDLHGKYFSRLSALDLPNLKNLSKDISWYMLHTDTCRYQWCQANTI